MESFFQGKIFAVIILAVVKYPVPCAKLKHQDGRFSAAKIFTANIFSSRIRNFFLFFYLGDDGN
jgi:hypothetical protein